MHRTPRAERAVFILALLPLLASSLEAQSVGREFGERYVFRGTTPGNDLNHSRGDGLGESVAGAGDVNQDGFDDVIVGVPWASIGLRSGLANVYSGKDGSVLWQLDGGEVDFARPGLSVAGAGDVNQDGFPDLVAGGGNSVLVFSGRDGTGIWHVKGGPSTSFADSVSGAGDVNNDGFPDVVVGAFRQSPVLRGEGTGSVLVYSGRDGTKIWQWNGAAAWDGLGYSVAGAGDVNQDGFADLIVGAVGVNGFGVADAGSVYVYSGKDATKIWQVRGRWSQGNLGNSVAGAGDVNLDGVPDVIAGERYADPGQRQNAGSAYVYSGKDGTVLWQFDGSEPGDLLGSSVAGAGDVDTDGYPDVIVGAPNASPGQKQNAGSAFVYSGKDGTVLWQFDGAAAGDTLGSSVAGAGDVNQDGSLDVILGAPWAGDGAGSAHIHAFRPVHPGAYGTGLAGTGGITPRFGTDGEVAQIGNPTFKIEVKEAVGGSLCLLAASLTHASTQLGGLTLYGDFLTPGAFATWVLPTSGTFPVPGIGSAVLPIAIPNDPSLVGFRTYWQGFVLDFGSSPVISHTGGLEILVVR